MAVTCHFHTAPEKNLMDRHARRDADIVLEDRTFRLEGTQRAVAGELRILWSLAGVHDELGWKPAGGPTADFATTEKKT